jgi:hypothetical protein
VIENWCDGSVHLALLWHALWSAPFSWWHSYFSFSRPKKSATPPLQSGELFSLDEIPEIPSELAGIWAYVMWEDAGCLDRSQEAADREYKAGIAELQACLTRGKTLDELWAVANGDVKYSQFKREFIQRGAAAVPAAVAQASNDTVQRSWDSIDNVEVVQVRHVEWRSFVSNKFAHQAVAVACCFLRRPACTGAPLLSPITGCCDSRCLKMVPMQVFIPDDLIGIKAYTLWKEAGQPQGADFSSAARDAIEKQIKAGASIQARTLAPVCGPCLLDSAWRFAADCCQAFHPSRSCPHHSSHTAISVQVRV